MKTVELGFIYVLQNPINGEFFYVGATEHSLKSRLKDHYSHLREKNKDKRKGVKRFDYLESLLPVKCNIVLLEVIVKNSLDEAERKWIKHFKKINPNLTNMTNGGKGGWTWGYYTDEEKEKSGNLISIKSKGVKKTPKHCENISISKTGYLNPNKIKLNDPIVALDKEKKYVNTFNYIFEINNFLQNINSGSNIKRNLNDGRLHYGFYWITVSQYESKIQDIVDANNESVG